MQNSYISSTSVEVSCPYASSCFECPYPACRRHEYRRCIALEIKSQTPPTVISKKYGLKLREVQHLMAKAGAC